MQESSFQVVLTVPGDSRSNEPDATLTIKYQNGDLVFTHKRGRLETAYRVHNGPELKNLVRFMCPQGQFD